MLSENGYCLISAENHISNWAGAETGTWSGVTCDYACDSTPGSLIALRKRRMRRDEGMKGKREECLGQKVEEGYKEAH